MGGGAGLVEFWARYGDWLLLGAVLLLFTRMHGKGGCCGGHRHGHDHGRDQAEASEGSKKGSPS